MDGAAAARRTEVHLARIGLGVGDQVLDVLVGLVGVGHQQVGHIGHARQRREVLDRVKGHLLVQRGVDGVRADGAHEQRVAVSGCLGGQQAADVAASAGTVVDHHGLAQLGSQALRHDARQDVGRATGRERHDDGDQLAGVRGLGQCGAGQRGRADGEAGQGGEGRAAAGELGACLHHYGLCLSSGLHLRPHGPQAGSRPWGPVGWCAAQTPATPTVMPPQT
ncbi:hypothetical protein D3C71_1524940 [compost metagenome]